VDDSQLKRRFFPEANLSGFSHVDGTVEFFNQIAAVLRPTDVVLDFGAGRGEILTEDTVEYRRGLSQLVGRCAHLDGCDIDPVVLENPFLDDSRLVEKGKRLPYADNRFDVIVSRYVFEHVEDPEFVAHELLRITKPGGLIAAITPNKWGFIGVGARIVPNRFHIAVLAHSQAERKPEDVFPTHYKLNTLRDLRKWFGAEAEIFVTRKASEPAYHFSKPWLYRMIKWSNKHIADVFLPSLDVYIRKRSL
jgi:SAM-dependent methyltransferase